MFQLQAPSLGWQALLAIVGAATCTRVAAQLFRGAVVWARHALLLPVVSKYSGEWALITGGSEGIGKAVAVELARYGLHVVLVSRSQTKLNAAASEIQQKHPTVQVRTFSADLTDTASCSTILRYLSDNNIHISVLIANAGGVPNPSSSLRPYWEITEHDELLIMKLNGQACYSLVKGLVPTMAAARKGAVVCISSVASKRQAAYMSPYGLEKAKVNALCQVLDSELQGTGVTAQAMVLGVVMTPMILNFGKTIAAGTGAGDSNGRGPAAAAATAATADPKLGLQATKKPSVFKPSAEAAAAAIVRSIGRGGPLVTPYWGHAVAEWCMFGWWPPELQRAILRQISRSYRAIVEKTPVYLEARKRA